MKSLKIIWARISFLLMKPLLSRKEKEMIKKDFARWCEYREHTPTSSFFVKSFAEFPEFRSTVYYRVRNRFRLLPRIFLPGQAACFFSCDDIGGGIMLIHGFSTIINCRSIGENCTIFQQVTIGYSKGGTPKIGSNCVFGCGALVLGNITIGDNVIIGAGAVVTRDIPSGHVATGNPAVIRPHHFTGDLLDSI